MYPGIELRLLRYAVVVAEELHFGRAALRLHVAQSTLSKQIGDLERELGVTLFDRTSRHVELTREGRNFVRYARKAVIYAERGVELAKRGSISKDRLVSIGYSPRMNLRLLSIVRNLSISERPEFKLALISLHTGDQVQALLHGSLHAGLVTLPIRNESLVVKLLVREALAVVMPESHPLTLRTEMKARELNGQPVIAIPRQLSPGFHDRLHSLFKRVGYRQNVVQEVTTEAEALYMVREGLGIAFMKISAIPRECPGIAYRRLRESALIEETGIAYRRDNRSENIRGFIGFLQGRLRDLAGDVLAESVPGQQDSGPTQLSLF